MKKGVLAVFFVLINCRGFAQSSPSPTQFDKFISNSKIEWAAYISDSFYFDKTNFNNLLISRLAKAEIKASLPFSERSESINSIKYLPKDSIDKLVITEGHKVKPLLDSNGNVVWHFNNKPNNHPPIYGITEVCQILYVQNGKLKTYVPFVTPVLPLFMSTGKYLGESFYFNTAYNFNRKSKNRKKDKIVFLQQTSKPVLLNEPYKKNNLKELYGKNWLETLWPSLAANNIAVFSIEQNRALTDSELTPETSITIPEVAPLYDSAGAISKYKIEKVGIRPADFTEAVLIQDWYYNASKNIVYNKIREIYLYTNDAAEPNNRKEPLVKLIFRE